ncbi:hypothetical protein Slin15195_G102660 [Septoria linicola]|uniref:Uncharacterized protein n=1 Tax=Septoria linicola TaxID=215465 RepID=A0A9Q9AW12_9PEZI|nr:hypothetical protein Slin14017_G065660 [Septoria linicola]USW56947.1 hypothetical protein Slin15195_G102660 [Septoria linicola]
MPLALRKSFGNLISSILRPRLPLGRAPPLKAYANNGKKLSKYTQWEDEYVARRRQQGAPYALIGDELGRSYGSVALRYRNYIRDRASDLTDKSALSQEHEEDAHAVTSRLPPSLAESDLADRELLSPGDRARLQCIEDGVAKGKSFSHIAEEMGISKWTVTSLFRKYNSPHRQKVSWSEDDVQKALSLQRKGHTDEDIGAALSRTPVAVELFLRRLRASSRREKQDRQDLLSRTQVAPAGGSDTLSPSR